MEPIPLPLPSILDPAEEAQPAAASGMDQSGRVGALEESLADTRRYGRQLWHTIEDLRSYLLDSIPSDPRAPGSPRRSSAPTGPDDDAGWDAWIASYARATAALAGPQGDSGFGLGQARRAAELRRNAPVMRLPMTPPTGTGPSADQRRISMRGALAVAVTTLAARYLAIHALRRKFR